MARFGFLQLFSVPKREVQVTALPQQRVISASHKYAPARGHNRTLFWIFKMCTGVKGGTGFLWMRSQSVLQRRRNSRRVLKASATFCRRMQGENFFLSSIWSDRHISNSDFLSSSVLPSLILTQIAFTSDVYSTWGLAHRFLDAAYDFTAMLTALGSHLQTNIVFSFVYFLFKSVIQQKLLCSEKLSHCVWWVLLIHLLQIFSIWDIIEPSSSEDDFMLLALFQQQKRQQKKRSKYWVHLEESRVSPADKRIEASSWSFWEYFGMSGVEFVVYGGSEYIWLVWNNTGPFNSEHTLQTQCKYNWHN